MGLLEGVKSPVWEVMWSKTETQLLLNAGWSFWPDLRTSCRSFQKFHKIESLNIESPCNQNLDTFILKETYILLIKYGKLSFHYL